MVELHYTQIQLAVANPERHGAIVQPIGFFVGFGGVSPLHKIVGLLEVLLLFLFHLFDLLANGEKIFRFLVVAFVAMATNASALAVEILALAERPTHVVDYQDHVRSVTGLAACFHVLSREERPEPMLVSA